MTTSRNFYLRLVEDGPVSFWGWFVFFWLWPLSCLYEVIVRLRIRAYALGIKKSYHASVPVVSVGNLSVGGTGKTPMVDFLAKWMTRNNVPTAIVSRGYGGSYSAPLARVVLSGEEATTASECGDEPFLLARRNPTVPVFVARRRSLGVEAAEKAGAKLIILDDGFQHRAVHRDLDIVLLDSQKPFSNGCLLPAGQLREPQSALERSHLIILTRHPQVQTYKPFLSKPTMHSRHVMAQQLTDLAGNQICWSALAGKSCIAFAGIAQPAEFFAALKGHNLSLVDEIALADHQEYDDELLSRLFQLGKKCDALITTEKDAVKLSGTEFPVPCYQVGVELAFEDQVPLDFLLQALVEKHQGLKDGAD